MTSVFRSKMASHVLARLASPEPERTTTGQLDDGAEMAPLTLLGHISIEYSAAAQGTCNGGGELVYSLRPLMLLNLKT